MGKVKLMDVEDGTKNVFVAFEKYLAGEVQKACELAHAFETKLMRGFSFYRPKRRRVAGVSCRRPSIDSGTWPRPVTAPT